MCVCATICANLSVAPIILCIQQFYEMQIMFVLDKHL